MVAAWITGTVRTSVIITGATDLIITGYISAEGTTAGIMGGIIFTVERTEREAVAQADSAAAEAAVLAVMRVDSAALAGVVAMQAAVAVVTGNFAGQETGADDGLESRVLMLT